MEFCVSCKTMKESDRLTIEKGTSGVILMGRAAKAVYESITWDNKSIAILVGKGNNGGDGYALACVLLDNGYNPVIYKFGEAKTDTSNFYVKELKNKGFNNFKNHNELTYNYDIIIDCIFGVGFTRELSDDLKVIFKDINSNFTGEVIAVDIPSGLNTDNGKGTDALKATKTIAIQSAKLGHYLRDGKDLCGEIIVKDIGIEIIGNKYRIVDNDFIKENFPKRKNNCNKGSFGKSVLIGGCINYAGATKLACIAESSLRMGCGLSVLAVPSSISRSVISDIYDNTIYELADRDGHMIFDKPSILKLIENAQAIAIGMGMGNDYEENYKIIDFILKNHTGTLILDADGLNSIALDPCCLDNAKCDVIITPHPKEMSRLTNNEINEILDNPVEICTSFSTLHNCTVLLKGTSTLIVNKNEVLLMNSGNPSMAKGGSGDVLSGAIVGLMARGISPIKSGAIGSYLCAKANEIAMHTYGEYGVLASDSGKEIGKALNYILNY